MSNFFFEYYNMNKNSTLFLFVVFSIAAALMVAIPFLGIWSINTLFGLAIAYSWKNWVAFFLLVVILNISYRSK